MPPPAALAMAPPRCTFSKVVSVVALHSKCTRALTFENVCHLHHWLWQGVLRHPGGMELTAAEVVGRGSWLDLMCALRVEPNVVNAPAAAYEPRPVCTLIFMYVRVFVCTYVCTYVCMYVCVWVCVCVGMRMCYITHVFYVTFTHMHLIHIQTCVQDMHLAHIQDMCVSHIQDMCACQLCRIHTHTCIHTRHVCMSPLSHPHTYTRHVSVFYISYMHTHIHTHTYTHTHTHTHIPTCMGLSTHL